MNKNYYVIEIINLLNYIRSEEYDFNEGSLTDDIFVKIISLLIKLYECNK